MHVADWLRSLGLEQYEPAFRENEIDDKMLPRLTAEDLKELGVTVVGHRRRLLDAIIALQGEPAAKLGGSALTRGDGPGSAPEGAERRQLTVLFCDLVGSTALASRLDPEDLREIIGAYHRCVAETVAGFDGFVARYMGDGVLLYFGYPQAHEDDAEQAVRAGLALVDAVGRLQAPEPLRVRVGIGTGEVVVGDLITSGEGQERGVVGETPNLAARLQALAEPGTVVIGPQTRRLLGDLFECRDLGAIEVKGFPEPRPSSSGWPIWFEVCDLSPESSCGPFRSPSFTRASMNWQSSRGFSAARSASARGRIPWCSLAVSSPFQSPRPTRG
jgi:class 3 adenylate cyclase